MLIDDNKNYDDRFDMEFDEAVELQERLINCYNYNVMINYDLVYHNDLLIPTLRFIKENMKGNKISLFDSDGGELDYEMMMDSLEGL